VATRVLPKSGGGPPHSKTLARVPQPSKLHLPQFNPTQVVDFSLTRELVLANCLDAVENKASSQVVDFSPVITIFHNFSGVFHPVCQTEGFGFSPVTNFAHL
jgi:hypothetical protein